LTSKTWAVVVSKKEKTEDLRCRHNREHEMVKYATSGQTMTTRNILELHASVNPSHLTDDIGKKAKAYILSPFVCKMAI